MGVRSVKRPHIWAILIVPKVLPAPAWRDSSQVTGRQGRGKLCGGWKLLAGMLTAWSGNTHRPATNPSFQR